MKVLALEPYYGGSHRAFLDGWISHSAHRWTVLGLPAHHWKWRMRHASFTLADRAAALWRRGERWDAVFGSDMLNLAEWGGLAGPDLARLPRVIYFHENQLTYPARHHEPRDVHFGFSHLVSALAADAAWFNSAFHRETLLVALTELLAKMPDHGGPEPVERVRARSAVHPPGVEIAPPRAARSPGPVRILWAARWEHDKDPDAFFEALRDLEARGVPFRLSVVGEQFREVPASFGRAKEHFAGCIDRWGFQSSREAYRAALLEADVFVSTAAHEFFGIAAVEAVAAGAYPLLPRRLAYPEVFADLQPSDAFLYDGTATGLASRLADIAERVRTDRLWPVDPGQGRRAVARYLWPTRAADLDAALRDASTR